MPIHQLKLIGRRTVARNTVELQFEKPSNLNFIPGQYAGFTLINPSETDEGGITRRFSILSSPHDEHLAIATRIQRSAYKRVLNTLPIGDTIKFAGPTGNFILHKDTTIPAVMIAGGIGIAPFFSMIKHATQQPSPRTLILFYGNQTREDAAYLEDIQALQKQNPHLICIPTFSEPDKEWKGETGFITDTMLKKYLSNINQPIFYICGSPAMVTALQETLVEMGIPDQHIQVEDFPGY
jgi:ferredoxin-NADP reductase